MAREIKIVKNNYTYQVRGIQDACAHNDIVVAAQWQDSEGVKSFAFYQEAKDFLDRQVGQKTENNSFGVRFFRFIAENWDKATAQKAFNCENYVD